MSGIIRVAVIIMLLEAIVLAQELKPIKLAAPDTTGGKPLMQVLKNRQSTREFSADTLTLPVLSNLFWAADGINRPESGKRTAPSAMNKQEISIYAAMSRGLYLYDPAKHELLPVLSGDIREKTGGQEFVKDVPLNLIYVADYAKMGGSSNSDKDSYAFADAAFIAANVYMFCASEDLGVVVRGMVDKAMLGKAMNLGPDMHIILAQSVGYPKK